MKVHVFLVPYDSGQRSKRMGAGPEHLLRSGVDDALRADGHEVVVEFIETTSAFPTEITSAIELDRTLADRVQTATAQGTVPVILSGNCNGSLGALAGIGSKDLAMLWFDAHGDFNNPNTGTSYFDGMAMSVATGNSWKKLAATIPDFAPLSERNVIHLGGRDFDPEEEILLDRSEILVINAERIRANGMRPMLDPVLAPFPDSQKWYVHIDLDVLDPDLTPVNEYGVRVPGGLYVDHVIEAVNALAKRFRLCGGGVASFDPSYDRDGRTTEAAIRIVRSIVTCAAPPISRGSGD